MEDIEHWVLGIYATRAAAESAFDRLIHGGLAPAMVKIVGPGRTGENPETEADNDDVLKEILRDGAIRTVADESSAPTR